MNWIVDLFTQGSVAQTILLLTLISAVGIMLGKIKFGSVQLGTSFVFFAAILAGHFIHKWNIDVNKDMMEFAKTFGLVIFVYTLGLQVGPGFFASLRKGGIKLNICSILLVLFSTLMIVGFNFFLHLTPAQETGLLSGSVTNTPAMMAGQQAVIDFIPDSAEMVNDVGAAYAVAYPFSVLGILLSLIILKSIFSSSAKKSIGSPSDRATRAEEVRVSNPNVIGKNLETITKEYNVNFVTSRLWRSGEVRIPMSDTVIEEGDHLLIICNAEVADKLKEIFGVEDPSHLNRVDIDWNTVDKSLVCRYVRVTKKEVTGQPLSKLKFRNKFGVNITRLTRSGITIIPTANTALNFGDRLTVVGSEENIKAMGNAVGNQEIRLNEPHLIPLLVGLFLGVLVGSIPLSIPGLSAAVKLGIAGGPILVGILMGAFGPHFHMTTYTTRAANLMMRNFGITFFFAAVGLGVGTTFVETVFCLTGLRWAIAALLVATVAPVIMGILNEKLFHLNFAQNIGSICGSFTNPNAIAFANSITESDEPSAAYATVYPVTTFLRILGSQIIVLLALT